MKIFFAGVCVIFLCSFPHAEENDAFRKGAAAYIAGNSDEAMILLYKAYTANPANEKTKSLLGEVYIDQASKAMASGDYVAASKYINEAEKLKVMEEKVIKLKGSLKSLLTPEPSEKIKKPEKPKPKRAKKKKLPPEVSKKKPVKKSAVAVKTRVSSEKRPPQSVSPIIIKERIIERPSHGVTWQKQAVTGAIILVPIIITAFLFFKLYLNERTREAGILEEKQLAEKKLKNGMEILKEASEKLKIDLAEEKSKKKPDTAVNYSLQKDSEKENKELKIRLEKMENSLNAIRTESAKPKPSEAVKFPEGTVPAPVKYFLPTYTKIPLNAFSLSEMLERASGLSARLNLLWALGNKTEHEAVDVLEAHLTRAKGEEYREILKSLKKIALRPETSADVKIKVEDIFSALRRKGIII